MKSKEKRKKKERNQNTEEKQEKTEEKKKEWKYIVKNKRRWEKGMAEGGRSSQKKVRKVMFFSHRRPYEKTTT